MSSVTKSRPNSVFVSYARKDRVCADLVVEALRSLKFTTFLDTRDIEPSADFSVQLEQQIVNADCMLVCVTPDVARHDSFVRREIAFALGEDLRRRARSPAESLRIFPVVFSGGVLPILISTWTALPVPVDPPVDTLAKLLEEFFQQPAMPQPRDTTSPNLQDYLHHFLADVVDMLGKSVDELLDLESSARSDLTKEGTIPSARGFRVSSAIEPLLGTRSSKQNQSSVKVFPTIGTACDHFDGRFLIVGAPGAGKTTSLLALAREAAADRLSDPSCPVPVLAQLNTWKPGSNMVEWATGNNPALRGQRLLLLLDGLDEMSAEAGSAIEERKRFLEALARDYPAGAVILTCRVEDFEKLEVQASLNGAVELSELSREQVATYLSRQSVMLSDELVMLAQRPLLLALLRASLIETDSNDFSRIHSEADIFDNFVTGRFRHESARGETLPFSQEETLQILGRVAAREVIERERILAISVDDIVDVFKGDAQSFLNFCLRMHLLSGDKKYPRFMHLRMRDYLATPEILRAFDAGEKWKPPWTSRDKHFGRYFELDIDRAFQEIAGFAVEGLVQRTLSAIDADSSKRKFSASTHIRVIRCFDALVRIGTSAIPGLSQIARNRPNSIRLVADTLSRISGAEAVNALVQLLGKQHDREVIASLGWTNCAKAVQPLLDLFIDSRCPHKREIASSLFQLRKFDESGFFNQMSNDSDADMRLWKAIYVLETVVDWSSPDAIRQQAIDEVKFALRDRRFDEDLFHLLLSIKDPEVLETVHDVLRLELDLARADSESSEVLDRIRLIQILGAQSSAAFIEVFRQATLDEGQLSSMDSAFERNSSVREAAQQALALIDSAVTRSAVAHPDSDGVFALAQSFDGDPAEALKEAAQRILERPPSKPDLQSDSIVVRTVLSALACVAITATLLWWPALIVATIVTFILLRGKYKLTEVVLVAPRAYGLAFWISDISRMVGQGKPIMVVTGAEPKFSSSTNWSTIATTALLAIIASFFVGRSAQFNLFWTIAYMVPGSLILLRFPSTPRHWGTFGLFSAFLAGRIIWSLTQLPLWLTLLISVAVFLAVSLVFSKRELRTRDTLGTVRQLESLAAELDSPSVRWRRWISPVPANYYVIRSIDWAMTAVATIITPYTRAIWFDAMTAQPHHIRDLITVCTQRQIPLMAIVRDHEVKDNVDKLLSHGIPEANICVFTGGLDQSSLRPVSSC